MRGRKDQPGLTTESLMHLNCLPAEPKASADASLSAVLRGVCGKNPDREYGTKSDGEQEAELIRLAYSEAPEGRIQWSLRLLSDKMVELGVVDTISHETVRQTLKKTDSSRIETGSG
jgi:hypothetical protein